MTVLHIVDADTKILFGRVVRDLRQRSHDRDLVADNYPVKLLSFWHLMVPVYDRARIWSRS